MLKQVCAGLWSELAWFLIIGFICNIRVSGKAGHGQDADTNSDADTNWDPMRIESIVACVCSVLHFVTLL